MEAHLYLTTIYECIIVYLYNSLCVCTHVHAIYGATLQNGPHLAFRLRA